MDTNETSFGLELSKDNGWVFLFPREDIGGIKPIDFAPIMGIREVDPYPRYFEKATLDSVSRFSSRIFSFPTITGAALGVDEEVEGWRRGESEKREERARDDHLRLSPVFQIRIK